MKLFRKSSAAAIVLAASLLCSNAHAVTDVTITGPSGNFGDPSVTCAGASPCTFEREFFFDTPLGFNFATINISTIASRNLMTNIDFSTVTFNGVNLFSSPSQPREDRMSLLDQFIQTGASNRIFVSGTTGGNASFAGNLSFDVGAVPEPATWLMMLLGFGAIGFSMRRKQPARRVQFA